MKNTPKNPIHRSIRPLLRKVGLDEKQVEIYLALLALKSEKVATIAKASRQSRSHTYIILRELQDIGLVAEFKEGAVLKFAAEPPETLLSFLKEREMQYKDLQELVQGCYACTQVADSDLHQLTACDHIEGFKRHEKSLSRHFDSGVCWNIQCSILIRYVREKYCHNAFWAPTHP